jgi:hypothetical protein
MEAKDGREVFTEKPPMICPLKTEPIKVIVSIEKTMLLKNQNSVH